MTSVDASALLSEPRRAAVIEMAESVDLVAGPDTETLPASHSANMMQIEATLSAFGDAVSMVHQLPLSRVMAVEDPLTATDTVGFDASAVLDIIREAELGHSGDERLGGAYEHLTRAELLSVMENGLSMVASREDVLVINQGMPSLDNLYMAGSFRQGFRDWTRVRVADRHWDLALACADLLVQCGPSGLAVFLDGYGIDRVDPVRLDWYSHVVALTTT